MNVWNMFFLIEVKKVSLMRKIGSDKWTYITRLLNVDWECIEHGRFSDLPCEECWKSFPNGIYVNLYRREISTLNGGGIVEFDNFLMYDGETGVKIVMFDYIVDGRKLYGDEEIFIGEVSRKYSESIGILIRPILKGDE